eukprot:750627-Hanusia_phi.AAC.15
MSTHHEQEVLSTICEAATDQPPGAAPKSTTNMPGQLFSGHTKVEKHKSITAAKDLVSLVDLLELEECPAPRSYRLCLQHLESRAIRPQAQGQGVPPHKHQGIAPED